MSPDEYQALALMTCSPAGLETLSRFVQNSRVFDFNLRKLFNTLVDCDFDKLKRTIFYGEPGTDIPSEEKKDLDLLHGLLGVITELFELIELISKQGQLDPIHLKEELGDLLWYIALIASSQEVNLQDVMESNIRKLTIRNRNKGKFDLAGTLDRALDQEYAAISSPMIADANSKLLPGDSEEMLLSQKQKEQLRGYRSELEDDLKGYRAED